MSFYVRLIFELFCTLESFDLDEDIIFSPEVIAILSKTSKIITKIKNVTDVVQKFIIQSPPA